MPEFVSQSWYLRYDPGWQVEADEDCVTLFRPDGAGVLQVSTYRHAGHSPSTISSALAFSQLAPQRSSDLVGCVYGDFRGYLHAEEVEAMRRFRWWLSHGSQVLFVTYHCAVTEADADLEAVERMLGSLKSLDRL